MHELVIAPDPRLRRIVPDSDYGEALRAAQIVAEEVVKHTFNGLPAIGLAANQVGLEGRVLIAAWEGQPTMGWITMINPHVVFYHSESEVAMEGCGSLPHLFLPVSRPIQITVQHQTTRSTEVVSSTFTGYTARVIQHEVDHLDGILITDRTEDQFAPSS